MNEKLEIVYEELLSVAEEIKTKSITQIEYALIRAVENVHRSKEYNKISVSQTPVEPPTPPVLPTKPRQVLVETIVVQNYAQDVGADIAIFSSLVGAFLMLGGLVFWFIIG